MVGDVWVSDSTEEDSVLGAKHVQEVIGHVRSSGFELITGPVKMLEIERECSRHGGEGVQYSQSYGGHTWSVSTKILDTRMEPRKPAEMTSGPMPSPGMTAIL